MIAIGLTFLASIYLFKVNNNTETICKICSEFTIKTAEQHH